MKLVALWRLSRKPAAKAGALSRPLRNHAQSFCLPKGGLITLHIFGNGMSNMTKSS